MKKLVAVMALLCMATVFAVAAPPAPHADQGDFMVNIGADLSWWSSFGVAGGAEMILAKVEIPQFAPLTFGAAAKADFHIGYAHFLDLAALGTMHLGLKTFTQLPAFLQNFDWWLGLGLGMTFGPQMHFGFASGSGISYYLNPKFALNYEYVYTWYGYINSLGIKLEL